MTVPRVLGFVVLPLWLALAPLSVMARPQDPTEKKTEEPKPETFFAGTVIEFTPEKITVSRVVLGKDRKARLSHHSRYEMRRQVESEGARYGALRRDRRWRNGRADHRPLAAKEDAEVTLTISSSAFSPIPASPPAARGPAPAHRREPRP